MKSISPFIAEILLIGFTVAIAAIIISWSSGFTKTSTQTIKQQSETQLICSYSGISTERDIVFKNGYLYGYVRNSGNIPLNINFQIIYDNGTTQENPNLISNLNPGTLAFFNLSVSSNIRYLYITTNCTDTYLMIEKSEIVFE
ncbi:MAG: hypothetical protein QXD89_02375 [Candidatus Aenigmatarchaeota archaeon]